MSTTTPSAERGAVADAEDRWADSTRETPDRHSRTAPLTFDSSCTRRVRSCIDEANAALPDAR